MEYYQRVHNPFVLEKKILVLRMGTHRYFALL